ncbi:MAG: type II secretion system F family protein [Candidatus Limnocylindrales bacterium]|jgi:tight adherence protein C
MLAVILAILVGGGILLLFVGLAASTPLDPVQARLTQLGSVQAKNLEELELQQPFAERTLRPLVARLSRMGSRLGSASSAETAERRLAMAGNPGDLRLTDWLGVKVLAAIATGAIMFLLFGVLAAGIGPGIFLGVVGFGIGYLLPEFWLGNRIKARQKVILRMIPDTLDLLTISVRAGLGFDAALAKVVEKLPGPLTDEFRRALAEVRVGKARRDALRDMVPRTNVAPLSAFIGAIIQAEQLGVSISKVLQVQSEQLRIERRQRAEEMAAKAPIKMLFPLVGCIFPSLFIVILGPAIIRIVQTMSSGVVP